MKEALSALLGLVYPPCCMLCKEPAEHFLCDACADGLLQPFPGFVCSTCGHPRQFLPCNECRQAPPAYSCARAASPYSDDLAHTIHIFKYRDSPQLAVPLGRLLARYARGVRMSLGELAFDTVTSVPMLAARERARGYNQADRLARVVAGDLGIAYDRELLARAKRTRPQVGLRGTARAANVEGAFRVPRPSGAAGKCILVIDDVSTTGSTLKECAAVLREAGAASVYALSLAAG